ncbi:hypothetical protein B0T21DRAFT_388523 [Apiosordaria backusii]|uniref:Uncharacterized protein n=1 Tax=Apiosordaria backusii TaxID=314023 RepID=A0AA40EXQ0_9PEZI|nr:hypothetical protein B0T21DRAFT_388523 [Apiosordaria backusii]
MALGRDRGLKGAKTAKRERSIKLSGEGPPRASNARLTITDMGSLGWIRHTRRPAEVRAGDVNLCLAPHISEQHPYFSSHLAEITPDQVPCSSASQAMPSSKSSINQKSPLDEPVTGCLPNNDWVPLLIYPSFRIPEERICWKPKGSPAAVDGRCAWRCPLLADSPKRHVASSPSVTKIQRGHGASPNRATLAVAEPGDRGRHQENVLSHSHEIMHTRHYTSTNEHMLHVFGAKVTIPEASGVAPKILISLGYYAQDSRKSLQFEIQQAGWPPPAKLPTRMELARVSRSTTLEAGWSNTYVRNTYILYDRRLAHDQPSCIYFTGNSIPMHIMPRNEEPVTPRGQDTRRLSHLEGSETWRSRGCPPTGLPFEE